MMMSAAAVAMAAAIAIDDGPAQEHLQNFFHLNGRGTGVDPDAQIVQQGDSFCTESTA